MRGLFNFFLLMERSETGDTMNIETITTTTSTQRIELGKPCCMRMNNALKADAVSQCVGDKELSITEKEFLGGDKGLTHIISFCPFCGEKIKKVAVEE